ncbi:MAG TPA: hypothetical protein VN641_01105 [Urbifossiella sp.]|nr:hypothetical protein [Urbifossiella sp.]
MPPIADADDWSALVRDTLSRYSEPLLRQVAGKLIRPRTQQPLDELLEKSTATLGNAPVIDRRIKDLSAPARKLLALIGLSRQPRWKVGHLISLLAALGHAEGFAPVQEALEDGLLFPDLVSNAPPLDDFAAWLGQSGTLAASVFAHPQVAGRARGESLDLPNLAVAAAGAARTADGLDWPLRLAAVWQQVEAGPVRLTQAATLFKRDQTRLQTDEVLNAPAVDQLAAIPDPGALALFWARAAGLLQESDGELRAGPLPKAWDEPVAEVLADLFAALPHVEAWDPLAGYAPSDTGLSPLPSAALLCLLLLNGNRKPAESWFASAAIARWLWDHHPSWAGTLPTESHADYGRAWVDALLLGVMYPLGLLEAVEASDGVRIRLGELGRQLFAGGPEPAAQPAFPQTLLVQPNAEVLAYRQGLTPALIGSLSRFARWKAIGPACTLELNAEQTYRGLESGLTLPMMLQVLARHGTRPVPANVADLLQRWSNKRERITVFSSAVLVEFPTAADLDAAIGRGIVVVRVTDRIGMTAEGKEPALSQLRLIGNRDYEGKPQRCVSVADDGVTLTVDAAQADLLLEAEIGRYADPLPSDVPTVRRFRLSPTSLRRAADLGLGITEIDAWFVERTGFPLSPAGRLFLLGKQLPPPAAARKLVIQFPTPEIADGVMQWPETRRLVSERLGPMAIAIEDAALEPLQQAMTEVGVTLESV